MDPNKITALPAIGEEVVARGLPAIGEEIGVERAPDFKTTNVPPSLALKGEAWGKDVATMMANALPGAGAIVGGALATPETAGGGTLAGAALGAGAGRGLRDLILAGLGLEKPSTAGAEAGRIALDTTETYVAGKLLPALWEAVKNPKATVGEVYDGLRTLRNNLPTAAKVFIPKLPPLPGGVAKAPASVLQRPAWQTWSEALPEDSAPSAKPVTTATSMVPAPMPGPGAVPPAQPAAAVAPPVAAPVAAPPVAAPAASAAPAGPFYPQKTLNEIAILARRGNVGQLSGAEYQQGLDLVRQGASPQQALEAVIAKRGGATAVFGAGLPTDAEVAARVAERNRTGRWPQ